MKNPIDDKRSKAAPVEEESKLGHLIRSDAIYNIEDYDPKIIDEHVEGIHQSMSVISIKKGRSLYSIG